MKNILNPKDTINKLGGRKVLSLTLANHIKNVSIRNPLIYHPEIPAVLTSPCWSVHAHTLCPHPASIVYLCASTICRWLLVRSKPWVQWCCDSVTSIKYSIIYDIIIISKRRFFCTAFGVIAIFILAIYQNKLTEPYTIVVNLTLRSLTRTWLLLLLLL